MVQPEPKLETYIVIKIMQGSHTIMNDLEFKLNKGTCVKWYNEKDPITK